MLNIKEKQSMNSVYISGILKELDIAEGTTGDGRNYVRGTAKIGVEQEINGQMVQGEIPVKMFAMQIKSDGKSPNPMYDRIRGYKDNFTSAAAAEDPAKASRVTLSGNACRIEENMWYDQTTNTVRQGYFQLTSNFLNAARPTDEESASFELSGVVGKMNDEVDTDGNPTGRMKINFIVIGYNGRANVVELIATDSAKAYIESNWEAGDTVNVAGLINMSFTTKTYFEEQGFGQPIKRTRTESRRELIITSGSPNGLEESLSYDSNDIKIALDDRAGRIEELKNNSSKSSTPAKANTGFNF